jgi:hypothetical protein
LRIRGPGWKKFGSGINIPEPQHCNFYFLFSGLCVDYSAHIMHRFLTESGGREERVRTTLTNIGPAVFNGGVSTFLAFILLATSKSHVFSSFFKIFFLVVTFGLYHGLLFLPVLLSVVGPLPDRRHATVTAVTEPPTAVEMPPTALEMLAKGEGTADPLLQDFQTEKETSTVESKGTLELDQIKVGANTVVDTQNLSNTPS